MDLIKEIIKYSQLREDLNGLKAPSQYTVYKATGSNTSKAFYGYVKGTGDEAIQHAFLVQAARSGVGDDSRGVQQLVAANGGDVDDIEFEELAVVDTEEHAFMLRNEERETDPEAITGPSHLPAHTHRAGMEMHPEIYARMMQAREFNKLKTAREAWAAKYFNTAKIKELAADPQVKQQIMKDLDMLSPHAFSKKYNLPIEQPA